MTTRSKSNQFQSRIILLTALAALVTAGPALPQNAASKSSANAADQEGPYSLIDISAFFGTQWYQIYQGSAGSGHDFFEARPVVGARVTDNFSKYVGVEAGYTVGFNRFAVQPTGGTNYATVASRNGLVSLLGVINLRPRDSKFRPFFVVGPGAITYWAGGLTQPGSGVQALPANFKTQTFPALVYGLGAQINLNRKFAVRYDVRGVWSAKTADFGLAALPDGPGSIYVAHNHGESSLQFTVGFVFRTLYHEPPAPVAAAPPPPPPAPVENIQVSTISGARAGVCPGDNVRLEVTASGWLSNQTPTYTWYVNGQEVQGATGPMFNLPTANASGTQAVKVTVAAGNSSKTSDTVDVMIGSLAPPTIQFSVSPMTIAYGDKLPLNATANASACGMPVSVRYAASEGSIAGNTFDSTGVTFDLNNRLKQQSQTVQLTATATDSKNESTSATANVTVTLKPEARRLDDIVFQPRSARVNNCGKRLLIDVLTPILRNDPDAKVILIGHRDTNESARSRVDEQRVLNAAAVLSAGKGICPQLDLSRVMVKWVGTDQASATRPALCGSSTDVKERNGQAVRESDTRAQYRRVEIWVVPGGAEMPAGISDLQPASEKEIKAKGCPR